ncbi:MAG: hypothetical protein KA974_07480 [Saprospiraceae bacterium]|nr:hypothetical protein [Saprospiraceae bacterium]
MKIFTLIFSFYLLGLSCLPCGDKEECTVKADTTISAPINHDNHSQDTEHCTPFCACSCCAASVTFPTMASYKIPKRIFPTTKYPVYNISYSSQVSFSIWQPPKLS